MSEAAVSQESEAPSPRGAVRFASADARDEACVQLRRQGWVVVEIEGIGPSARGRLAEVIEEATERELASRGAAGPGVTAASDEDAALSDRLFRARRAGACGIAIVLGPMRAAGNAFRAMEPEDSATLRFLARATGERPLALVLDARDATTGGYGPPTPLSSLLGATAHAETSPQPAREPAPPPAPPPARIEKHTAGASVVVKEEAWRAWLLQLTAARGPQPLSALERLFAEAYMPLANAIAAGLDDPKARAARDEFRATFAKSYTEAFPTFAAAIKRPRMVLDAHDVAARIARLHGARTIRMLLVDAMRSDVTRMIEERLVARLGAHASLTDELLLWSALPTTTIRALETVARGVEAIRAPADLEPDPEPTHGRTAEFVRRIRVGPRELHKLDIVESRVRSAGRDVLGALAPAADAAAAAIAHHAESLSPRTLLFVFGDHGFSIDKGGAATQGGASPEEVLAGAFAMLVGDVH